MRRLCKPRYKGDPPEPKPKPDREPDPEYYRGVTLIAQHRLERLILLELGCTYGDLRTMPAEEAQELLAAHVGRKQAESQAMEEARADGERRSGRSGGSMAPAHAWQDASYWNADTSTWGNVPNAPPTQAAWVAKNEDGGFIGPVEPWMLEYGLPPE